MELKLNMSLLHLTGRCADEGAAKSKTTQFLTTQCRMHYGSKEGNARRIGSQQKKHESYFQILQQIQKNSDTNMADQLPYSFQEVEAALFCYGMS